MKFIDANGKETNDFVSIVRELDKNATLGLSDELEPEVQKWLTFSRDEIAPLLNNVTESMKQLIGRLARLQKALESSVFVLPHNRLSLADLVLFVQLAPVIVAWSGEERTRFDAVTRWFDHVQHLRPLRDCVKALGLYVAIDQRPTAPKPKNQQKKESHGGKDSKETKKDSQQAKKVRAYPFSCSNSPQAQEKKGEKEQGVEPTLSRLDLRVGRIVSVKKHPNADALYHEEIDLVRHDEYWFPSLL